jgi:endoribonuclease Dicer
MESEEQTDFRVKPRGYQLQALEQAKRKNTIAFIDTGAGKTLIAFLLAKHISGKSVFLAPTRLLTDQQATAAEVQLQIRSKCYNGNKYGGWSRDKWQEELRSFDMLVFTPQLFINVLNKAHLRLEQFQLLIFDECHHCIGDSSYAIIMGRYFESEDKPRVLGLTASPVNKKTDINPHNLQAEMQNLCSSLDSEFCLINRSEIDSIHKKPEISVEEFSEDRRKDHLTPVISRFESALEDHPDSWSAEQSPECEDLAKLIKELREDAMELMELIGNRSVVHYMQDYLAQVQNEFISDVLRQSIDDLPLTTTCRFKLLVSLLQASFEAKPNSKAIVFVERRDVCEYLYRLLSAHSSLEECGIVFGKVSGQSKAGKTVRNYSTEAAQRDTLARFRSNELNCIVSTSVGEEGLDVSACNLAIRFDSITTNLRSFVQSKGRARHPNSKYICLVPSDQAQRYRGELENLIEAHRQMTSIADASTVRARLLGAGPSIPERSAKTTSYYSVQSTGARCEGAAAISKVNELVQAVFRDPNQNIEFEDLPGFQCKINFPGHLSLYNCISRGWFARKDSAKRDACLAAVERLHQAGLLDDDLMPIVSSRPASGGFTTDSNPISKLNERVQTHFRDNSKQVAYEWTPSAPFMCSAKLPGNLSQFNSTSRGRGFSRKDEAKRDACLAVLELWDAAKLRERFS